MNILLIILDDSMLRYAVVPRYVLKGYHYKHWDGVIITDDNWPLEDVAEEIMEVFKRLGLVKGHNQDLRKYMHAKPPYTDIGVVLRIGWVS